MYEEDAPYGKVTTNTFYDDDRTKTQTLKNPGHADEGTLYEYDPAGRQSAITDAAGDRRTIGYDNTKNVMSRSDARGFLTKYEYDGRDELIKETGPEAGQVTTYAYDLGGNRTTETWANGNVRTSTYDVLERREQTTDNVGSVESFTYTPDDQVATRTDANNHTTTNHYDGLHRLYQQDLPIVPPLGARQIIKTFDVHGDVLTEKDPGGHIATSTYDALGRRVTTTLPDVANEPTATLHYGYDLIDRPTSQTDARGNVTTIVYDDIAHTKTQTDPPTPPDGTFTQTWTYDALNNEVGHIDRRGIATNTAYDALNRVLTITRDNIVTSTRAYLKGFLDSDTDANSHTTSYKYDNAGRKIEEDRPLQYKRTWTYLPMGDVHTATDADSRTTTSTYTPRRYLETETNNAGETTTYGYDGEGHRTSMQRPMGDNYAWTYAYDEGDRLVRVIDPNGTTQFGYDLDGNKTSQTDANGHVTAYTYDARHHRSGLNYPAVTSGAPNAASASWDYDADGNVIQIDTPNGRTRTFDVDALNRITHEGIDGAAAGEISDVYYTHDGNGNVLTIAEHPVGAPSRTAVRSYDGFDRLDTDLDVKGKSLLYRYDAVGNRLSVTDKTDPNQALDITTWSYNELNQNTGITVPGQGITTIDNWPSGLVHIVKRPDTPATTTSTTTAEYDAAGRIATITHASAGGEIAYDAYDYDLNGNRWHRYERNGALTQNDQIIERTTTYGYDHDDWLTDIAVTYAGVPERTTHYELDAAGNRTREQIQDAQGVLVGDSVLAYNEREQLCSRDDSISHLHVDINYDADGNTATETDSSGTLNFGWDGHDRLLALSHDANPPYLRFDYQSDGLRIAKTQVGGAETDYHYDGQSLLTETNSAGNTLARYHYSATQLLSRTETSSTPTERQYLNDALNTPIATLNQGTVDSRTLYDAWGEIISQQGIGGVVTIANTDGTFAELPSTDNQDIGFTGYIKDTETGFYYAKARYYDPRIARFTTQDPEEGKAMQPPSLHRYLYAYANPTVYVDPSGRAGCEGNRCTLLQSKALATTPEDKAMVDRLLVQNEHDTLERVGTEYEATRVIGKGLYNLGKFGVKAVGVFLDAPGSDDTIKDWIKGADQIADTVRAGPEAWTEHYVDKSLKVEALRKQGKFFEAGRVWGPELATALTVVAPAISKFAGEADAADSFATTAVNAGADATRTSKLTPSQRDPKPETSAPPEGAESETIVENESGRAPQSVPTRPAESPNYSVAYRAQLKKGEHFPNRSDEYHFQESNKQLDEAMKADPEFAARLETEYPGITAGVQPGPRGAYPRRAPTADVTWHHHPTDEGAVELTPTAHHEAAGPVQSSLHPARRGGMENWGGGRKKRKTNGE